MKPTANHFLRSSCLLGLVASIIVVHFGTSNDASAASQTWKPTPTDANWATTTNWVNTAAPGSSTGAATSDVATFNTALSGGTLGGSGNPITLDATRSIGGIAFSGASVGSYQIGTSAGPSLILSTAASSYGTRAISLAADTGASQTIAANIKFVQPSSTNGFYGFVNNASNSAVTLTLSGTISSPGTRPVSIVLDGANTGANTISGAITSTSAGQSGNFIVKNGAGRWDLTGNNIFSSNNSGSFGANMAFAVNLGTLNLTGNNTFQSNNAGSAYNFTVNGGTAVLSGSNTFTGSSITTANTARGIIVNNGGLLVAQNNNALGSTANSINNYINNGGTLELNSSSANGSITLNGNLTLQLNSGGTIRTSGNNATASVIKLSSASAVTSTLATVGGSDVFTVGDGANDLSGGASDTILRIAGPGTVFLSQASDYAGTVSVDAGTLQLGNATALGSAASSSVAFGASSTGKLNINGNSVTISKLNSDATVGTPIVQNTNAAAATLTVSNTSGTSTFAGVMQDGTGGGALSLTKDGASTLALSGNNTFSGGTTISGGILSANHVSALGTGEVSIASAATLSTNALNVGSLTLSGGANIQLTNFSSQITSLGAISISGSSNILTLSGSAAAAGNTYDLFTGGSLSASGISLTGSGVSGATVALGSSTTVGRTNYAFSSTSTTLQLAVTGGAFNLTWNGGNANWNTTDATWQKDGTGPNIAFFDNDNITIDTADTIAVDVSGATSGTLAVTTASGTTTLNTGALNVVSLSKSGAGTLQLDNAVTSSGTTTVSAGIIALGSTGSLTTGDLAVTGGTLDIGTSNASATNVSLTSGSINGTSGVLTATTSAYDVQSGSVGAKLAGSVGLTKTASGLVVLSGANTYSGATAVNDGTLTISGSGTLGSASALTLAGGSLNLGGTSQTVGAVSITAPASIGNTIDNGTLTGDSYSISNTSGNAIVTASLLANGSIGLDKTGAGILTLSGTNSYTGATNVRDGALVLDGGNDRLVSSSAVVLGDTGTIGKLVLGDTTAVHQTLTGVTTSGAGGTVVGGNAANSTLNLDIAGTTTLSTVLGGAGTNENNLALAKTGAGTLILSATNTFTGGVTLNQGTLSLTNSSGAGSNTITAANGTTINNNSNTGNAITVTGTNANITLTNSQASNGFSGNISGSADQTVTISNAGGQNVNTNSVTKQFQNFDGTVSILSGATLVNRSSATNWNNGGDETLFDVTGAISSRNAGNWSLGALTGSGTLTMGTAGSNGIGLTYTIGARSTDTSFSGAIQDGDTANGKIVSVVKTGTAIQTFSGTNTYTGATTINAGKLVVNGSTAGGSAVTVSAGTLNGVPSATLGGFGTVGGSLSLAAESTGGFGNGGVLAPTASASGTALSVTGTTTFGTGSIFEWNLVTANGDDTGTTNQGSYGQLAGTGAITGSNAIFNVVLAGNSFASAFWDTDKTWNNVFSGAGVSDLASIFTTFSGAGIAADGTVATEGQFTFNGSTTSLTWNSFTAVPEPTTALAGLLLGAGLLRRRRKN